MSYDQIRDYIDKLSSNSDSRIDTSVVRSNQVSSRSHDQLAGLQVADALASSIFYAVNLDEYRNNETCYAEAFLSRFYRHQDKIWQYGLKDWPVAISTLTKACPHLAAVADWK